METIVYQLFNSYFDGCNIKHRFLKIYLAVKMECCTFAIEINKE